jgi:tRNA(adenine34) deaminase
MTYHERFMRAALDEAMRARDLGEVPVGAVVVRDGEVIASAHNETVALGDPTAHAEMLAIRRALARIGDARHSDARHSDARHSDARHGDARLDGCSLYVTLEPCPMCAGAIVLARMRQLIFGAYDAKAGSSGTLYAITTDPRLNHRVETHGGVLDDECASVLRTFFTARR